MIKKKLIIKKQYTLVLSNKDRLALRKTIAGQVRWGDYSATTEKRLTDIYNRLKPQRESN